MVMQPAWYGMQALESGEQDVCRKWIFFHSQRVAGTINPARRGATNISSLQDLNAMAECNKGWLFENKKAVITGLTPFYSQSFSRTK
jgi:hypothetical protein